MSTAAAVSDPKVMEYISPVLYGGLTLLKDDIVSKYIHGAYIWLRVVVPICIDTFFHATPNTYMSVAVDSVIE
jgi:hypothetical protein